MYISRKEILKTLRENVKKGIPIIGTGAGTGISGKCEELGGSDLLICYNTGYFRMQGRPSTAGILPLGDANTMLLQLAREVLPVVKHTPVIAGVFANDPFRDIKKFLGECKELGFSGIQNFPTMGGMDGHVRQILDGSGFTYDVEVDMIKMAHEMDMLTTPYCWCVEEAEKMTKVGADIIVAHAAMTVGGTNGIDPNLVRSIDDACMFVQEIADAAHKVNPDALVIAHGGPIATPKDVDYVLNHTKDVVGFYGASSAERIPVETAIINYIKEFKAVRF